MISGMVFEMNIKEIFVKFPQLLYSIFLVLAASGVYFIYLINITNDRIYLIPALICFLLALVLSKKIDKSKKKKEKEPDKKLDDRLYF